MRQWAAAAVFAVSVLALAVSCSAPPPAPSAAPSRPPIRCGDGFGPPTGESGTSQTKPVWSSAWTSADPGMPQRGRATDGTRWYSSKAPIIVLAGTAAQLSIIAPRASRLVVASAAKWSRLSGPRILDLRATTVRLPSCPESDTYPSLVLAPRRECVVLDIAPSQGPRYRVTVSVGGADCDE